MFASSSKHAISQCLWVSRQTKVTKALTRVTTIFPTSHNSYRQNSTSVQASGGNDRPRKKAVPFSSVSPNPSRQLYKRGSRTSEYNLNLRKLSLNQNTAEVLEKAAEMKKNGIEPDSMTYSYILQALSGEGMYKEAWAVIKDMEVKGINPDVSHFNSLLKSSNTLQDLYHVLDEMKRLDIALDHRSYDIIIKYFVDKENTEMALCRMADLLESGVELSKYSVQVIVGSLVQKGEARLALDIAVWYEKSAILRLDNEVWVKLLGVCSEKLYADGVLYCWEKVVTNLRVVPNEGLCQEVLHTAARHGLPVLASDTLQQLEASGIKLQEYHFSPLIDAFVRNGQIKEAFKVLDLMRSSGVTPTLNSAQSLKTVIERDPDMIDAAYTLVEELLKEGEKVDVVAINILISACVFRKDVQRAVGIYKAMPQLSIEPSTETFEALLHCCERSKHIELAERLFGEIQGAGLKPSEKVYEWMILTAIEQDNYEDAFFYLEELKATGNKPSYTAYEMIIRKCFLQKDSRYKVALEELRQMGYKPLARLQNFLDSDGKQWSILLPETKMPGRGKTYLP